MNAKCLTGLAVFAALSAADFYQTHALITGGGGEVYEANPVAGVWLERYGWEGLAAFKAAAVAVFVAAVVLVARRRPRTGTGLAALGCAALLCVTTYSQQLLAEPKVEYEAIPPLVAPKPPARHLRVKLPPPPVLLPPEPGCTPAPAEGPDR